MLPADDATAIVAASNPLTPLRLEVDPSRSGWLTRAKHEAGLLLESHGLPVLASRMLSGGSDPAATLATIAGTVCVTLRSPATADPISRPAMRRGDAAATGCFPAAPDIAGKEAFRVTRCVPVEPVVADGILFHYTYVEGTCRLYARDAAVGTVLWHADLLYDTDPLPPCVVDGRVYYADGPTLVARTAWDGAPTTFRIHFNGGPLVCAPVFHAGVLMVGLSDRLFFCDTDGTIIANQTCEMLSSVAADNSIAVFAGLNSVFAVDLTRLHSREARLWGCSFVTLETPRRVFVADGLVGVIGFESTELLCPKSGKHQWGNHGGRLHGKVAVAHGVLYRIDRNKRLLARNLRTGDELRSAVDLPPSADTTVSVCGDTLFLADEGGELRALDLGTFETRWTFRGGAPNPLHILVADGLLYFCDTGGCIYALY